MSMGLGKWVHVTFDDGTKRVLYGSVEVQGLTEFEFDEKGTEHWARFFPWHRVDLVMPAEPPADARRDHEKFGINCWCGHTSSAHEGAPHAETRCRVCEAAGK